MICAPKSEARPRAPTRKTGQKIFATKFFLPSHSPNRKTNSPRYIRPGAMASPCPWRGIAALANWRGLSDEGCPRLRRNQSSGAGGLSGRSEQASAGREDHRARDCRAQPAPRRQRLGSFKINRYNGRWADFATGDKGGDPVSLVAYLADVSQGEAARLLAQMLGPENRRAPQWMTPPILSRL